MCVPSCCPPRPTKPERPGTCTHRRLPKPVIKAERRLPSCIKLRLANSRVVEPKTANVQLLFQAMDCKGNPVVNLRGEDFNVLEGPEGEGRGRPVSSAESQQTILPRRVGAEVFFLLLLDMSGSVQKAEGGVKTLQARSKEIVGLMIQNQSIALAVFDGSAEIHLLQDYTRDRDALRGAIDSLSTWKTRDSSTNLYGAYIKGLAHLQNQMRQHRDKFSQGLLFLLTDGTDQAARHTLKEAEAFRKGRAVPGIPERLEQDGRFRVVTIGVGGKEEIDRGALSRLADEGSEVYGGWKEFNQSKVEELARRLDRLGRSFHVLSYCSPKRRGTHQVQIEVSPKALGPQGRSNLIFAQFSADGFGAGCDADAAVLGVAECGGESGKTCDPGYSCDESEYRCVSLAERRKAQQERRRREEALLAGWRQRQAKEHSRHRSCQARNAELASEWTQYEGLHQRFLKSDCGFRLRLEGGLRIHPTPQGVAGAILAGWSFPRWVELHAGLGFYPVVLITEARVKPWTWRWLDLTVTPRVAVGVTKSPFTFEADLLVGLRARMGRYFAMFFHLGPGYAQSSWGPESKKSFVLPGWLGAEVRF